MNRKKYVSPKVVLMDMDMEALLAGSGEGTADSEYGGGSSSGGGGGGMQGGSGGQSDAKHFSYNAWDTWDDD